MSSSGYTRTNTDAVDNVHCSDNMELDKSKVVG